MDGGVKEALDYPLSDADIRTILGDEIPILTYTDLNGKDSIPFDRKGRCILLIPNQSPTDGHWCCLLKRRNEIEFFDPYGEAPETQKENIPDDELEQWGMNTPILTKLLRQSRCSVFYNTYPFQKEKNNINTCGRHCVVRCLYSPYSLAQYKKAIAKSGLSPDQFVVGITADILKK